MALQRAQPKHLHHHPHHYYPPILPSNTQLPPPIPASTIRFRCYWKTVIYDVLQARKWTETESDLDWDFFWSDVSWMHDFFDHVHLAEHQRINHFRNYYELTRKDLLIKNLKRMKKMLEKENKLLEASMYNFFPPTYALPAEYGLFVEEFKKNPGVWIMKPVGKAQGKGIFLFTKLAQISEWKKDHRWKTENPQVENYIVQKYVDNPYLVGGKKFDLRIYVLVISYAPLKSSLQWQKLQQVGSSSECWGYNYSGRTGSISESQHT